MTKPKTRNTQIRVNTNTQKRNLNLNQHTNLRTVHMCVRIIVHNCRTYTTQHRTVLIIFHPNPQTIITGQMLSFGGEGRGRPV